MSLLCQLYCTAMPDTDVTIRECVSIEDFKQCIELERAVWKDDDIGIMPIRLYMISKACNAPTIGAFDQDGRIVGFVHTSLALIGNNIVFHSHLAAVLEGLRHKEIGARMKLAQRERAIELGIPLIIWTFDPLQSRNAHLNINKLGAIIHRYEVNYYGEDLSSVFGSSGIPSDRIFAEWWVKSPHVESVLSGNRPQVEAPSAFAEIPDNIDGVSARSRDEHLKWRLRSRADFQRELGRGLIVRGFERSADSGTSRYLFGPDEEQFQFSAYDGMKTIG
jgi:predicted GNAT superfamily acetyltransferase